ncbi:MAG: bifunctional pyr operon transcriptional regulator/uracil phosphoribosyltransferase PyrR [Rhodothermales bacterium]|nr:bifunctional pyr operon transcriptional regulator/uracil phosphoribosyltransferase PyrR [Rhodothermales bacterium]
MQPNDVVKAQLLDERDLGRMLDRMAQQIVEHAQPDTSPTDTMALIGMQSRGVHLARRLRARIEQMEGVTLPLGILDATMYRDDFRLRLKQPQIRETRIPFDLTERQVFLVDDVLYTGRTVRAALDALMDIGRPAAVHFVAIVDRGLRELPIRADIVGRQVPTLPGEEVRVRLTECDDRDGVWLVTNPEAGGRP